jgi:hypothetical protein
MQKLLIGYLVLTGFLAAIALAVPSLVVFGFFLLILPGIILSLAPTAFLWGCMFAIFWWPGRMILGDILAAIIAIGITAALLYSIPSSSRTAARALLAASVLPDVVPSRPIAPRGDIRIDLNWPRWDNRNPPVAGPVRAYACDNLCMALLFTPGVTSVTVNASSDFTPEQHRGGPGPLRPGAQTYRLVPKAQCGARAIQPDLEGNVGLFGKNLEENRALDTEWKLRLSTEFCLTSSPPIERFALLLREGRYAWPEKPATPRRRWSLAPGPAQIDYAEIRDGAGKVLARQLVGKVSMLARPFAIAGTGGIANFAFGWAKQDLSNARRHATVDLLKLLKAHSTLGTTPVSQTLLPRLRTHLQAAVADTARPAEDPVFNTLEVYFAGISEAPLGDEDRALVDALLSDQRIIAYPGLYHLKKLPPAQHAQVRATIVRRLLAEVDLARLRNPGFSGFLRESPPAAFATPTADEQRLLAAPELRGLVPGMIARQSDRGAAAVPLLLDVLRYHGPALNAVVASRESSAGRSDGLDEHRSLIDAAREALCRLGPVAAPALPEVERLIATGAISAWQREGHRGAAWNLTLARLGKPLEALSNPEHMSGSDATHRRNLADRLERFDPERSCD